MRAIHIELTLTTDDLTSAARRTVIARSATELEGAIDLVANRALEALAPALDLPED